MNRSLLLGLGLITLLALANLGAQAWQLQTLQAQQAEQALARSLPAQAQMEAFRAESLQLRARTLGEEQSFVAYVSVAMDEQPGGAGVDISSVADLLRERVDQLGFDLAAVLAVDGRVLASSDALLAGQSRPLPSAVVESAADAELGAVGLLLLADRPLLYSLHRMQRGGSFDGHLLAGVYLRPELLDGLAGAVGASVGLFHLSQEHIRALAGDASLAGRLDDVATALRGVALTDPTLRSGISQPQRISLRLDDQQSTAKLSSAFGDPRLVWLFQTSADEAQWSELVRLPWGLATLASAALLALYLIWQQLALWAPLQRLANQLEGAAQGDFRRQLAVRGDPSVQRIVIAFNQLMQRLRS